MKNFYSDREDYEKRNDYKRRHSYLNWDLIGKKITFPIILFACLCSLGSMAIDTYSTYKKEQYQLQVKQEEKERLEREEQEKIESIRRIEEEAQKRQNDILLEAHNNAKKASLENDNKIAKKNCPKGTYVKNTETGEFGQITSNEGLEIFTNLGWCFLLKNDGDPEEYGTYPDNVITLSFKEYNSLLLKMQEDERYSKANDKEIAEAFANECKRMETELRKKFPKEMKYGYLEIDGKPYRLKGYDGGLLILDNGRRINGFAENIHSISYKEYETIRMRLKYGDSINR